jgi:hypothetical protein
MQTRMLGLFVETSVGYINLSAVVHIHARDPRDPRTHVRFVFAGSEGENINAYEVGVSMEEGQEIIQLLKQMHEHVHGHSIHQTKAAIEGKKGKS